MSEKMIKCERCDEEFPAKYRIEMMQGESKYYDPICALVVAPKNETYKLFRDKDKQEKLVDFTYHLLIPPPTPIEDLRKRGLHK